MRTIFAQNLFFVSEEDNVNCQQISWIFSHPSLQSQIYSKFSLIKYLQDSCIKHVDKAPLEIRIKLCCDRLTNTKWPKWFSFSLMVNKKSRIRTFSTKINDERKFQWNRLIKSQGSEPPLLPTSFRRINRFCSHIEKRC